jgi:hypothetical protein
MNRVFAIVSSSNVFISDSTIATADDALVRQLPAFFRILRGQKPTEEKLRKIVHKIKEDSDPRMEPENFKAPFIEQQEIWRQADRSLLPSRRLL